MNHSASRVFVGIVLLASSPFARGGESSAIALDSPETKETSALDRLWALPTLCRNDDASFLNELRFIGRAQIDAYTLDSNLGSDSDRLVRRLRAGLKARFFHRLEARVDVEFDAQNPNPFYRRLTDAYLEWKFDRGARLIVGKQAANFTLDGATSSNELLTIDRSNLANNLWFTQRFIPGATLRGEIGAWMYNAGVFSGGSESPEFGDFDASPFLRAFRPAGNVLWLELVDGAARELVGGSRA